MNICLLVIMGKFNFCHKKQKWGCSDLNYGMRCRTHQMCQVDVTWWYSDTLMKSREYDANQHQWPPDHEQVSILTLPSLCTDVTMIMSEIWTVDTDRAVLLTSTDAFPFVDVICTGYYSYDIPWTKKGIFNKSIHNYWHDVACPQLARVVYMSLSSAWDMPWSTCGLSFLSVLSVAGVGSASATTADSLCVVYRSQL